MNGQMTLAEAATFARPQAAPGSWLIALLLFLALLRKLGLLPPDKDDEQYTSLGVAAGFDAAAVDAKAKINAGFGDPWTKKTMCDQVDYYRSRYSTGSVSLV